MGSSRFTDGEIEALLTGQVPEGSDLALLGAWVEQTAQALTAPVPTEVAARHIVAAIDAASSAPERAPDSGWRRRLALSGIASGLIAKVLGVTVAVAAATGGAAAAGALPAPIQDSVASVAQAVGVDLPDSSDTEDGPDDASPRPDTHGAAVSDLVHERNTERKAIKEEAKAAAADAATKEEAKEIRAEAKERIKELHAEAKAAKDALKDKPAMGDDEEEEEEAEATADGAVEENGDAEESRKSQAKGPKARESEAEETQAGDSQAKADDDEDEANAEGDDDTEGSQEAPGAEADDETDLTEPGDSPVDSLDDPTGDATDSTPEKSSKKNKPKNDD